MVARAERRRDEGLAVVETTIVLLLLLVLFFGIMEYGWLFYAMQIVSNAAREGVREAILPDATDASVDAVVDDFLGRSGLAGADAAVEVRADDASAVVEDVFVTVPVSVTVRIPYADASILNTGLFPMPSELRATATMTKEGPT